MLILYSASIICYGKTAKYNHFIQKYTFVYCPLQNQKHCIWTKLSRSFLNSQWGLTGSHHLTLPDNFTFKLNSTKIIRKKLNTLESRRLLTALAYHWDCVWRSVHVNSTFLKIHRHLFTEMNKSCSRECAVGLVNRQNYSML